MPKNAANELGGDFHSFQNPKSTGAAVKGLSALPLLTICQHCVRQMTSEAAIAGSSPNCSLGSAQIPILRPWLFVVSTLANGQQLSKQRTSDGVSAEEPA